MNALIDKQSIPSGGILTGKSTINGNIVDQENDRRDPPAAQDTNKQQAMSFHEDLHTFEDKDEANDEACNDNHP
jgi:hypothetical protein